MFVCLGAFAKLRKAAMRFVVSVCLSAWNNSAPTWRNFIKFDIWVFFENLSGKFKFVKIGQEWRVFYVKTSAHFLIISYTVFLRMRNVSDESCRENQNTHFIFDNFPPPPENRVAYEIMWKSYCRAGQATCVLFAGYRRLQAHTQNM